MLERIVAGMILTPVATLVGIITLISLSKPAEIPSVDIFVYMFITGNVLVFPTTFVALPSTHALLPASALKFLLLGGVGLVSGPLLMGATGLDVTLAFKYGPAFAGASGIAGLVAGLLFEGAVTKVMQAFAETA